MNNGAGVRLLYLAGLHRIARQPGYAAAFMTIAKMPPLRVHDANVPAANHGHFA